MKRTPEERAAWAAKMKEYYRTHPGYAESVRARTRAEYERVMADPVLREKERARQRDKERRRRAFRKPADPAKKHARSLLLSAVRCGRIVKPSACEDCGGRDERIEAHHDDYSKPLQVHWLCTLCHGKRHRRAA